MERDFHIWRRKVLMRFVEECDPAPTGRQLQDWQIRCPTLAIDLAEFANVMARSPAARGIPYVEPDEAETEASVAEMMRMVAILDRIIGIDPAGD